MTLDIANNLSRTFVRFDYSEIESNLSGTLARFFCFLLPGTCLRKMYSDFQSIQRTVLSIQIFSKTNYVLLNPYEKIIRPDFTTDGCLNTRMIFAYTT